MASVKNMTSGSPLKILLAFAFPLMVGNVFQQMYTFADSMIVGKVLGVNALAAVGNGEWLNWLVVSVIQGFAQGFSIRLAHDFGAGDYEHMRRTYATSLRLSVLCAAAVLVSAFAVLRHILRLLRTPVEIFSTAVTYLSIIFAGVPIVMAYNFLASALRALGDGKTPLRAMVIASLSNIALDLLFVMVFHWGVAGAAAATLMGQGISAAVCWLALRKIEIIRTQGADAFDKRVAADLMKLSLPFAFQNIIISVGGLTVQFVVNGYGVLYIAGFTATNKLYGLLENAAISYGYALTTYVGQNYGAEKLGRIHRGVHTAVLVGIATAGVIGGAMLIFGRSVVGLFISAPPQEAAATVEIAYRYLAVMAAFLPVLYLLHIYRSALQGLGDTVMPMVSGGAEFVMRTASILLLPRLLGERGLYWAESLAWLGADVVLLTSYYVRMAKIRRAKPASSQK